MHRLSVSVDGYTFEVELNPLPANGSGVRVWVNGQAILLASPDPATPAQELEWFIIDDHPYEVAVDPDMQWIRSRWGIFPLKIEDLDSSVHRPPIGDGRVKAPIPGLVTQVLVSIGQEVASGQPLLILEAMKMENEIRAPRPGRVKLLNAAPGRRVALNELLVEIE
jgi:biotin carboxyl carrier protein